MRRVITVPIEQSLQEDLDYWRQIASHYEEMLFSERELDFLLCAVEKTRDNSYNYPQKTRIIALQIEQKIKELLK